MNVLLAQKMSFAKHQCGQPVTNDNVAGDKAEGNMT